jgi:hypothetical protein
MQQYSLGVDYVVSNASGGESFICVYWVAMPKVLRARRINRGCTSTGTSLRQLSQRPEPCQGTARR